MESPKIYKKYGEDLTEILIFSLMRNGFMALNDFNGINEQNFQSIVIQPVALTVRIIFNG